ncbi:hypothetical protein Q5P01_012481 [Channa striata]|uniref:Uncharacterized protein n=1 Tax=Channa striata TaxID=64152 RepID=A0AA88MS14_CHASR|nr:hypothetical protein Q5P01_012481 [Channa striata]
MASVPPSSRNVIFKYILDNYVYYYFYFKYVLQLEFDQMPVHTEPECGKPAKCSSKQAALIKNGDCVLQVYASTTIPCVIVLYGKAHLSETICKSMGQFPKNEWTS